MDSLYWGPPLTPKEQGLAITFIGIVLLAGLTVAGVSSSAGLRETTASFALAVAVPMVMYGYLLYRYAGRWALLGKWAAVASLVALGIVLPLAIFVGGALRSMVLAASTMVFVPALVGGVFMHWYAQRQGRPRWKA